MLNTPSNKLAKLLDKLLSHLYQTTIVFKTIRKFKKKLQNANIKTVIYHLRCGFTIHHGRSLV